ncbi:MAG: DUF805 domain-containing protein [Streptomyces sp.]|jgi:uncharacterized membrane protein YhaH (DUF805 family)|nr:DUF805 domain-containing protein [Streptomyces sp.]
MHWYTETFEKYSVFSGRARRAEYWMFHLVNLAISLALVFIGWAIGFSFLTTMIALTIFTLVAFLPSLALSVRRLHDTGRSGWWVLVSLIPVIGWVPLLIVTFVEGEPGDNAYGESPKYVAKHR